MAKVILTIEDRPEGGVKVVATPSFETIMKMDISGELLTPAQGYAIAAMNRIREVSKESLRKGRIEVQIPRLKI